jgi:hypothetical protein
MHILAVVKCFRVFVFSCFHVLLVAYYSRKKILVFLLKIYNLQKHENTTLRPKSAQCVLALSPHIAHKLHDNTGNPKLCNYKTRQK